MTQAVTTSAVATSAVAKCAVATRARRSSTITKRFQGIQENVTYTDYVYPCIEGVKNSAVRRYQGHHFVTAEGLKQLFLAELCAEITRYASPLRIIKSSHREKSDEVDFLVSFLTKSIEDPRGLIARWERRFWIQLPEDTKKAYQDEVELTWVEHHKRARTQWSIALSLVKRDVHETIENLISKRRCPEECYNQGLMMISENNIPWLPTSTDLIINITSDPLKTRHTSTRCLCRQPT